MPSFINTINPCPFGFFDSELDFQSDADAMVTFVKRRLGDDILSVELTSKQIWACFEEATLEYANQVHQVKITSELANVLGMVTSSNLTNRYPRQSLEFLMRQAEPYATYAGVMGSQDPILSYIDLTPGVQDYDLYDNLKSDVSGTLVYGNGPGGIGFQKLRILDIFHFEPLAAQQILLNASNITNFLATNFNYESYVNSTVFYVLPVFEDILRRGMLEQAFRVRRSHYSYEIIGKKVRIYPVPSIYPDIGRLYFRVAPPVDPMSPSYQDQSLNGVSGPNNFPLGNIPYNTITQPGRQWIRQYTLALAREILGLVRSKFKTVPIPNAELTLDGDTLVTQGREDKEKLITQLREFLGNLTHAKLLEQQASAADNMIKQLRLVPIPAGKAITMG